MNAFKPAWGLKNHHLQSILSSTGPRKLLEKRRAKRLLNSAQPQLLTSPQGVTLLSYLSKAKQPAKGLAIIVHGWEGSADSLYMLATGQRLLDEGYDVARLNLRDHGDTHHLNKALFNSTRLQEVAEAVKSLCAQFGGAHNLLCGYSLGGNFCLRVANIAKQQNIALNQVIAICPLLHPPTTMDRLNNGFPVYEKYFVKKWKRSLFKKLQHHNHFDYGEALAKLTTLDQMNDFFVIDYTEFKSTNDYFEAYSILGDALSDVALPTTIISAVDDPIIPVEQHQQLFPSAWINIELQQYGGHCAFIKNWKFESWLSDRIACLVNNKKNTK
ncbi:hypothetical protein CW745_12510 [Psychromonas sp. psych-6C06]|uniref:YheT family hydrolase n=1 Tax=Psychromonas sp. psych-6C06 TaxID=2058089 RepID=UPI000C330B27|nr:alpha/beta fold hydrolase [Psychromonas sp. psych-6C06]PKF61152.1 hypothetical protein CW745_12510 [Psychromonas sp. psych-6C06]